MLVAPCWVVTAGHAVASQPGPIRSVTVAGRPRDVAEVVPHPQWRPPVFEFAGDAAPMVAVLRDLTDIALIRLAQPVRGVTPARLNRRADEVGQVVEIIGRGATGTGLAGEPADAPHRGELRRATNRISAAEPRWIVYRFDAPFSGALPTEGIQGRGDSGGPLAVRRGRAWLLVGLTSWRDWRGDLSGYRYGVHGQDAYNVRISHYVRWIDQTVANAPPCGRGN
ncbi:MAG: trypsin-like serine protease [Amphiplicatus sp.]